MGDANTERNFESMDIGNSPPGTSGMTNGEEVGGHGQSWLGADVSSMNFDDIPINGDSTAENNGDFLYLGNETETNMHRMDGLPLYWPGFYFNRHHPAVQHSPPSIQLNYMYAFHNPPNSPSSTPSNGLVNGLVNGYANQQLAEQLNGLSINHHSENAPYGDNPEPALSIASDMGIDEHGYGLTRWFKPSLVRGIPPSQLLVYNLHKHISHIRKRKPPNFPVSTEGDTWVDAGSIVISIAGFDRGDMLTPVVWGVYFGLWSPLNQWGPVRAGDPQNKKAACICALQKALNIVYRKFFLLEPDFHTVIIKNSSPWLTRALTGGFEFYTNGYHIDWLEGHRLLYLNELEHLISFMKIMMDHESHQLKFRFWCVEPEANREAIDLAQRVYTGSSHSQ